LDTFTHIALGACVGEAFFERGFGKKAMWWGALAQSIPDIDFISVLWMSTPDALLAHRGFTHSLLFGTMIAPVFSLVANQVHKPRNIRFTKWLLFFFVEIFLHLLVDGTNNYGIGWLEPFSHQRFSFNVLFVADPFFTLPLFVFFLLLLLKDAYHPLRELYWQLALAIPSLYLSYCVVNKGIVNNVINKNYIHQYSNGSDYFTTPAPFQNYLWYVVIPVDSGFRIGFVSVFDKKNTSIFHFYRKNEKLLDQITDHESLQRLIRFSGGYYTVERWHDTLVFNDLRFGQVLGWRYPQNHFVFHYYLTHSEENGLVVQRGRWQGWSRNELYWYAKRICGQ
jgi:inner membrane protein